MIFKQGEMINTIDVNVTDAESSMKKAVDEVKETNDIMGDQDGFLNKVCIAVIIVVFVLLLMIMIIP